ncbi:WxcM-like domain-containing protein [Sphingobacterium hotanense]|uniref:WxcM-like domain-containing protein n=1 Tax=Sphingobacterium hotanense TaxID=649196 RepID=UPI0021A739BD|nr:WxcM-like domain-containing protein [Sphingobacterium hotanense]MCT1523544.1 WxcM-like domain-containing protein [Sphingobacterium hotanense]
MIKYIQGGIAKDQRGQIRFVNDFDMNLVKRFYIIKNADLKLIRGWRAHRMEQRWFYVLSGSFSIDIVEIDNWDHASPDLPIRSEVLNAEDSQVLHLSKGYGTAFQALKPNSEILVFSDFGIENAPNDDYTYPIDYFTNKK